MFWVFVFFASFVTLLFMGVHRLYRRLRPSSSTANLPARVSSGSDTFDQVLSILLRPRMIAGLCVALMLFSFWNTSVVNPGGNQIAQYERIYACSAIKDGRNIALDGECGRQAYIKMPGFDIQLFAGVLNNIEYKEMVDVPDGHYATLSAKDGRKLEEGQVAAQPWPLGDITVKVKGEDGKEKDVKGNMLDASFFLTYGKGQKGPQTTILPPGRYAINTYLWDVRVDSAGKDNKVSDSFIRTTVPTGFVGVVKSAINENGRPAFFPPTGKSLVCAADTGAAQQIKALLVPVGSRGVWSEALPPGEYFVNRNVYSVELHDTRMQNLVLAGGYTRHTINLTVDGKGDIKQEPKLDEIPVPKNAKGPAVSVKVEGWTVEQELRIQFRTKPECAPLQAASLGKLEEVEDRIIIPQAISVLRNIGGSNITVKNTAAYEEAKSEKDALKARLDVLKDPNADVGLSPEQRARETATLEAQYASIELPNPTDEVTRPTRVLDFQNEREALEQLVATQMQNVGQEAGIEIVSVTFGNVDIPPELLVARKVEQLSGQLRNAYTQMRTAQVQRQATEAAKARADKQFELVAQQIATEKSELKIKQRDNDGEAERRFNEKDAEGQKAQADVLGADKVVFLRIANRFIEALEKNPEILGSLKLPSTVVAGGGLLDGPAAILKGAFGADTIASDVPAKRAPNVAAKQ